jgi:predicted ATPase
MLTRLYATNYRCLVNFELKPSAKQLIIGRNGTGKTSVLDVLAMLRDFVARDVSCEDCLGGSTRTVWQELRPRLDDHAVQLFEVEVNGNGGEYRYALSVEQWPAEEIPYVKSERLDFNGGPLLSFVDGKVSVFSDPNIGGPTSEFPSSSRRSAVGSADDVPKVNPKLAWFRRWLGRLLEVQINPWAMSARSERESRYPNKDLSNFADWYRHLRLESGDAVSKALKDLREALPGFETLDAREAGLDVRVLRAFIRGKDGRGDEFIFTDLSEGQRVLIALYVLLNCAVGDDRLLLIDEPDNFIALAEIQPWLLKLLDRVDDTNGQVILVSHHPELLNQLASQGGILLDRPGGGEPRVRPFPPGDDTGLTPAEIIARGWENA